MALFFPHFQNMFPWQGNSFFNLHNYLNIHVWLSLRRSRPSSWCPVHGHREGGCLGLVKILKTLTFKTYWKFHPGLHSYRSKTSPVFFFLKYLNKYSLFSQNGPWQAGWLSFGQIFFVKFGQTCDEQTQKIQEDILILVWVIAK